MNKIYIQTPKITRRGIIVFITLHNFLGALCGTIVSHAHIYLVIMGFLVCGEQSGCVLWVISNKHMQLLEFYFDRNLFSWKETIMYLFCNVL